MAELKTPSKAATASGKPNLTSRELAPDAKTKLSPEQQRELNLNLIKAVQNDKAYAIVQLLNLGADIEARDSNSMTPLIWAAAFGKVETCKLLVEHGASIEARDNFGNNAFMRSKMHGNKETTKFLSGHMLLQSFGAERAEGFMSNFRECTGGS
jgi:ankyrin repeat protein